MEPYTYKMLTQAEREEMMQQTLLAQERDYFMHSINADRYELILADTSLNHESEFAARLQSLLIDTLARKEEVKLILHAVLIQMG